MKTFKEFINESTTNYKYSPKTKEDLIKAIEAEVKRQGLEADLNCIDTSMIKDMSYLFNKAEKFNGDISQWDVSNVTDMDGMFSGARNFNQDISHWDVSKVMDMSNMFWHAESFDQDISMWDVREVKRKSDMFKGCSIQEKYKPKFN